MEDNQGKRPDQIEFSEKVAAIALIGMIVIVVVLSIGKLFSF